MKSKDRERKLNELLAECEEIYQPMASLIVRLQAVEPLTIPENLKRPMAPLIYFLIEKLDEVAKILKQVNLEGAVQGIASRPLILYQNELRPKREFLEKLLLASLDWPDIQEEQQESLDEPHATPVWNVLVTGHDFWSYDDSGTYSTEELERTSRLLYSSFFEPDEWLRNSDELQPVLGEAADKRIPGNIRVRLNELYRSFILGNHLAAIALARATLEYALVDRSTQIGIDPFFEKNGRRRTKPLGLIAEDATEKLPALGVQIESIVQAGNKTLHPKKKDSLVFLPSALRHLALETVQAIRSIIEELYLVK